MRSHDAIRRKLRHHLLQIARGRRQACANQPSGEDLKVIARCELLAASTAAIGPRLCGEVNDVLGDPPCARRFAAAWDELPDAIGTTLWPRTASDLLSGLVRQSAPGIASRRNRAADAPVIRADDEDASPGLAAGIAAEFTGGLAVVTPMLAIWEVSTGLHQWREASFAAHHASTLAQVRSIDPGVPGRDTPARQKAVIAFAPGDGAQACQVTVGIAAGVPVGGTLAVVPRSPACEAPIVADAIGDPTMSFGLAVAFAVTGLLSLKAWCWLRVWPRPVSRVSRALRVAL